MAKLLYIGTQGTNDPTMATFAFLNAKGAVEEGHQAGIVLMGEATQVLLGAWPTRFMVSAYRL